MSIALQSCAPAGTGQLRQVLLSRCPQEILNSANTEGRPGGSVHRRTGPGDRQNHLPERPGQDPGRRPGEIAGRYREAQSLVAARTGKYTVGRWMDVWYESYAKIKVRSSPHQTCRGYIGNHIKQNLGSMPLNKLSSLELQRFYKKLRAGTASRGSGPRINQKD